MKDSIEVTNLNHQKQYVIGGGIKVNLLIKMIL